MSNLEPSKAPPTAAHDFAPLAGFLSYLVPGLGQIAQGRFGKGLLFLVCIYTLFFYGLYLGTSTVVVDNEEYRVVGNVYLPDNADKVNPLKLQIRLLANLYNRPQFLGQFWVGIAAWPAIWQYFHYDERADNQLRGQLQEARQEQWKQRTEELEAELRRGDPLFGQFQRTPTEEASNVIQNCGDKLFELGWVYTVIAGVLNIMVIYDALAGPAFPGYASDHFRKVAA